MLPTKFYALCIFVCFFSVWKNNKITVSVRLFKGDNKIYFPILSARDVSNCSSCTNILSVVFLVFCLHFCFLGYTLCCEDVPQVEFMYLIFTCMSDESYHIYASRVFGVAFFISFECRLPPLGVNFSIFVLFLSFVSCELL